MPTKKTYPVVVQAWEESERGWGTRPDGYSIHLTDAACKKFIEQFWANEKKLNPSGIVPDEYTRPDGGPYIADVSAKTYRKLQKLAKEGKPGFWVHNLTDL